MDIDLRIWMTSAVSGPPAVFPEVLENGTSGGCCGRGMIPWSIADDEAEGDEVDVKSRLELVWCFFWSNFPFGIDWDVCNNGVTPAAVEEGGEESSWTSCGDESEGIGGCRGGGAVTAGAGGPAGGVEEGASPLAEVGEEVWLLDEPKISNIRNLRALGFFSHF